MENMHECQYKNEIERIGREVYGGERLGLIATVATLNEKVSTLDVNLDSMRENMESIDSNIGKLLTFQIKTQSMWEAKESAQKKQMAGLTIFLTIVALILTGLQLLS